MLRACCARARFIRARSAAVSALVAFAVGACSSVPDFKPSKPVEEASSLNEALDLCAAYQIQGPQDKMGRADPVRSVALVPWINCFEKVLRKFPAARERESFVMFFRALQSRHDGTPSPDAATVDWPVMNYAVTRVIEHVKNPALRYGDDELRAIERQFPGYWIYLAESGRMKSPANPNDVRRSQLGEVSDEIGATQARRGDREKLPPRPVPLSPRQKDYCRRYASYRALVGNVEELAEYKRVLDAHTHEDVGNANERTMRERVEKRFSAMKKEAIEQKDELDKELVAIQAQSSWFRNGHCFESAALLRKGMK